MTSAQNRAQIQGICYINTLHNKENRRMFNLMDKNFKSLASTSSATPGQADNKAFSRDFNVLRLRTERTGRTPASSSVGTKSAQTIPITSRWITPKVKAHFWCHVNIAAGCWMWTGSLDAKGYGRIRGDGMRHHLKAHRVAWFIRHGECPGEMLVCHTCDNPACVNPAHLFLGTVADNTHDMLRKGRDRQVSRPGELNPHAKLTEYQVRSVIRRIIAGQTNVAIAATLPVGHALISRIRTGRVWQHVSAEMGYRPQPSRQAPKSGRTRAKPNVNLALASRRRYWSLHQVRRLSGY